MNSSSRPVRFDTGKGAYYNLKAMGKRKRKQRDRGGAQGAGQRPASEAGAPQEREEAAISSAGKKTIGGGVVLLILGFVVLTLTDPHGKNWASTLSPLMILGAYGIIAYGIFLPEPVGVSSDAAGETESEVDKTN